MKRNIVNIINQNDRFFAFATFVIILLIALFSRIPEIDAQFSGLDIEKTHYYQSGRKIAEAFGVEDFMEMRVSPIDTSSAVIFNSLEEIENKLRSKFNGIEIRSIHHARSLFKNSLKNNKSIKHILQKASSTPIINDLISKDHESFLIIVTLNSGQEIDIAAFDQILAQPYEGIQEIISMSTPHVEYAIQHSLKKDVLLISVLILIAFSLIILVTFKNIRALVYISIIILASILPTFFFFNVFNISLNLITALTIPIILVLSLADGVHLLTGFYSSKDKNIGKRISSTMENYLIPSFLTSLTTTIAFSSFLLNSAENLRAFGLLVSLSVLPSFVFTYALTPYLFKHLVLPIQLPEKGFKKTLNILRPYSKPIAYSLIIMAVLAIPLAFQLKFNTNFESFIPQNSNILKNRNELIKDFGSQLSVHVLIEKDTTHSSKSRLQMEKDILEFAEQFKTIPTVSKVKSIKDELQFKKAFGPLSKYISIPNKDNPYKGKNSSYRIELRLTSMDSLHYVEDMITKILYPHNSDYKLTIYSKALLLDEINKKVATSFLKSLSFSFALIFLVIFLLTRSFSTTLISFFVNIIPLSFIILLFYFLKLDLNILTAVTTVICLGLMVDDTIHIIYRKKVLGKENNELEYGIIITSLVLVLGFAAFGISNFHPSKVLGVVTSIVLLITTIADLLLLPYILDNFGNKTERRIFFWKQKKITKNYK